MSDKPTIDELNDAFESFQNDLEIRGTHKKLYFKFETDEEFDNLFPEEEFDLDIDSILGGE